MIGQKFDENKEQWSLLPLVSVKEIIKVLQYGSHKYAPDSWQHLVNPNRRYYEALLRHITSWWEGEAHDKESGLLHLAHAGANVLFLLWFQLQEKKEDENGNDL